MNNIKLNDFLSSQLEVFADDEQLDAIEDIVLRKYAHSRHVGIRHERCEHDPREKAFYEQWMKENEPIRAINSGHGILQDLFIEKDGVHQNGRFVEVIGERDSVIVATVIQWLGSNCGMSFLREALKKAGYKIVEVDKQKEN